MTVLPVRPRSRRLPSWAGSVGWDEMVWVWDVRESMRR